MKKRYFNLLFLSVLILISCQSENSSEKIYSDFEKSLINEKYKYIWNLDPVFKYDEAVNRSNLTDKNILLLFTGINNTGDSKLIWEQLNSRKMSNLIDESYVFCVLFTDIPYKLSKSDSSSMKVENLNLQKQLLNTTGAQVFLILSSDENNCLKELFLYPEFDSSSLERFLNRDESDC